MMTNITHEVETMPPPIRFMIDCIPRGRERFMIPLKIANNKIVYISLRSTFNKRANRTKGLWGLFSSIFDNKQKNKLLVLKFQLNFIISLIKYINRLYEKGTIYILVYNPRSA